jgi:hypothetical protein
MARKTIFLTAASWPHILASERHEEHDFANLLLEFRYAWSGKNKGR